MSHPALSCSESLSRRFHPALIRAMLLASGLFGAGPVMAYLDPNAGGWLYQLLFPVLVAIGALWAGLRTQLTLWWARWRSGGRKNDIPPSEGPADHHER